MIFLAFLTCPHSMKSAMRWWNTFIRPCRSVNRSTTENNTAPSDHKVQSVDLPLKTSDNNTGHLEHLTKTGHNHTFFTCTCFQDSMHATHTHTHSYLRAIELKKRFLKWERFSRKIWKYWQRQNGGQKQGVGRKNYWCSPFCSLSGSSLLMKNCSTLSTLGERRWVFTISSNTCRILSASPLWKEQEFLFQLLFLKFLLQIILINLFICLSLFLLSFLLAIWREREKKKIKKNSFTCRASCAGMFSLQIPTPSPSLNRPTLIRPTCLQVCPRPVFQQPQVITHTHASGAHAPPHSSLRWHPHPSDLCLQLSPCICPA